MKLEKFNLEKALNGAKIVTRDGREVTQLTKFEDAEDYSLGAVLEGKIQSWSIDGYCYIEEKSNTDLFLVVEPQRIWINIYRSPTLGVYSGPSWSSKELALSKIDKTVELIKTIEITDEL
jgi:hypothetical protein